MKIFIVLLLIQEQLFFLFSIQTPTIWEFNSVLSLLSKNVIVHDFIVYVFKIIVFMLKTLKLL